jgi:hypothetical protein
MPCSKLRELFGNGGGIAQKFLVVFWIPDFTWYHAADSGQVCGEA